MTNENKRPDDSKSSAVPAGVRARNRTMIMGAGSVNSMRVQAERSAPLQPTIRNTEVTDSTTLSTRVPAEGDSDEGFVSPLSRREESRASLDDIFGRHSERGASTGDVFEQESENATPPPADFSSGPVVGEPQTTENPGDGIEALFDGFDFDERSGPIETFVTSGVQKDPSSQEKSEVSGELGGVNPVTFLSLDDDLPASAETEQMQTPDEVGVTLPQHGASARIVRGGAPSPQAPHVPMDVPSEVSHSRDPLDEGAAVVQQTYQHAPSSGEYSMTQPHEEIFWKGSSPLVGFLVSYDHNPMGDYVELHSGRLVVSRNKEESGSCLVIRDESVSPMHAIMRVSGSGVVQVLDQLSESGTRVRHAGQRDEEFLSGDKTTLSHGDIVFFGERKFYVLLVSEPQE